MLDLRLLHQAITLARFRNYARAAQALHLTQPALSRSIAGLEARLGERLFNRTQRGVEPTAFGALLLARGQTLLDEAAALEREFTQMRGLEVGELRVGAGAYAAHMSVGRAVGELVAQHPGLRIAVLTDDVRVLVDALLSRQARTRGDRALHRDGRAAPRRGAAAAPPGALLLSRRPSVGRREGAHDRADHAVSVRGNAHAAARRAGVPRPGPKAGAIDRDTGDYVPPVRVDSIAMVKDVVLASDAVAAAPLAFIADDIASGRLVALRARAPWMQTAYGFVHLRDAALSPAADAFRKAMWTVERSIEDVEWSIRGSDASPAQRSARKTGTRARATDAA